MSCRHQYRPSIHPQYEECALCGTYHSLVPASVGIYTDDYWSSKHGHSTIYEQVYNVECHRERGVSKNEFVCAHITVETRDTAMEIACAPGRLLSRLRRDLGFEHVIGIEADKATEKPIRTIGNFTDTLLFGLFPAVTADIQSASASLIIGLDIFEHSDAPEAFLAECARLLNPGGELIMMLPLSFPHDVGLGRMLDPAEHLYLHGWLNIAALLQDAGLIHTASDQWTRGHELIVARKATEVV